MKFPKKIIKYFEVKFSEIRHKSENLHPCRTNPPIPFSHTEPPFLAPLSCCCHHRVVFVFIDTWPLGGMFGVARSSPTRLRRRPIDSPDAVFIQRPASVSQTLRFVSFPPDFWFSFFRFSSILSDPRPSSSGGRRPLIAAGRGQYGPLIDLRASRWNGWMILLLPRPPPPDRHTHFPA